PEDSQEPIQVRRKSPESLNSPESPHPSDSPEISCQLSPVIFACCGWRPACPYNVNSSKGDTMAQTSTTQGKGQEADNTAIRPFHVSVPETELTELRRRINATRWPEQETVSDASQGVKLATTQALARYWATEYDWRKIEAKMNALPQFITEIDG